MNSNRLIENGVLHRAGATPFQLTFSAPDLKLPFPGTFVVPYPAAVTPDSDQAVIDRMKSQNIHDWLFLSFRYPRRDKLPANSPPPEPHEKVFPFLRGPNNRPFRIVAENLLFFVESDYSPIDSLRRGYKENITLSARPKILLLQFDNSTVSLNGSLIPPLTRDAGTLLKGSDPGDVALQPLRNGLTASPLQGTIYAFDLGGHQVESMSAMLALGVPRAHILPDPESSHPDDIPGLAKLFVQFVNPHGDPLVAADLPAGALKITPAPTPVAEHANVNLYAMDMTNAANKVKFERIFPAEVPADEQYKHNFVHVGLWPGAGTRLQPVTATNSVTIDLGADLDPAAGVPQFVRFCVFSPADEFQTDAGGGIDEKGDFATNKFKLFTDKNKITVFNSGADYFADLAKELTATPGEDIQSLYLTNWATEAHLLMGGSMSAYGIEPNESDVAAMESVLTEQVNGPDKTVLIPLDPVADPPTPPAEDGAFVLLTRREAGRSGIQQSFQASVKSTVTPEHPDAQQTHKGFVRRNSLCAMQVTASGGNPIPHQITASWKNSGGDVSTVTHNLTLPAKKPLTQRFPVDVIKLGINAEDPPRPTLIRKVPYDVLLTRAGITNGGPNLQLVVLNLKAGRYEFIPLNPPGQPDPSNVLLHTFDKLFAIDPIAVAIVERKPEADQDFNADLKTRFREIEYAADDFLTGNVPLSTDEWGGMLRRLIASKPINKPPVKALYWENFLASLASGKPLDRGLTNAAALTAVVNRTVNGRRGYAIRDRATRAFGSFHQKATVIVKTVTDVFVKTKVIAYVGGMDLSASRWDREEHHHLDPERQAGSGWHDVQVKIEGDAALDVLRNFKQRWEALGQLVDLPETHPACDCRPANVPQDLATVLKSKIGVPSENLFTPEPGPFVQITRTIPPNSCYHNGLTGDLRFVGEPGELGSYGSYLKAIRNARKFIMIHDQYLFGIEVARAVHEALVDPKGPEFAIIVMPKDLSEADVIDPLVYKVRQRALHALLYGADYVDDVVPPQGQAPRFVIRTPQTGTSIADKLVILSPINRSGDEIYVHSKHIIVDDVFMSIGSSNHTARGTTYEMEINAAILGNRMNRGGTDAVRTQRVELCRRMLGLPRPYGAVLQDPQAAFRLFKALELESGLNVTDGITRAPTFNLHPLKPVVKKVDPAYAKRVSNNVPFNTAVGFVMAMNDNAPGLDFIARNILENDGRDRQHDQVGELAAFVSLQLDAFGMGMTEFGSNTVTAYARSTFDFSGETETAIQARLNAGNATFLDVSLIYGPAPGEVVELEPDPLHIHNYPIALSSQGSLIIQGLEVNELLVPISTIRQVTIMGTVTDSARNPIPHYKGSHLFDPGAPGSTILPGSYTSVTISVDQNPPEPPEPPVTPDTELMSMGAQTVGAD